MASKTENPVQIFSKYLYPRPGTNGEINDRDAKESEEYADTVIWNENTWKHAIKPFLGKGAASFASKNEEASKRNNTNNNDNNNNNNDRYGSEKQIDIFCGGDIPIDYANEAFANADVIFISRDIREDGTLGSLRGFLCLNLGKDAYDNKDPNSVYIDLICNARAARAAANRQGKINASGKVLLFEVIKWAKKHGFTKVALKALETVIPYYYKFGWRFITKCTDQEKDWIADDVKELYAALKAHHKENSNMEDLKQNPDINKALEKFKRWLPNLTNETMLRTIVLGDNDSWDELPDYDQTTLAMHVAHKRDAGYPMLLCLDDSDEGVASKQGGGRRRRRRSRKKKTKKSTKTRRKKHRKKRTSRRRRGGNGNSKESRFTRRARTRGVNIMPTIREPRIWHVKENKRTGANIIKNHTKTVGKTRK